MLFKNTRMFTIIRKELSRKLISEHLFNTSLRTYSNVCLSHQLLRPYVSTQNNPSQLIRFKSKKTKQSTKAASETEGESEESTFDDQIVDKNTKIMNIVVKSTRIDLILKSGLGIARNKIETLFYESKIRVNGKKLLKKSDLAQDGDEIDIVRGPSTTNPNFLTVARVEVLGITEKGDNLAVKIRRCKNLTVEKYEDYKNQDAE